MELKVVLMQFILFTLVEGAIYAMFYYKWCKCKKFKLYHILIMSVGNYIISTTLAPVLYQCVMALWMGLCISFVQKKFRVKYIGYAGVIILFTLIIEIIYNIALDIIINIDLLNITVSGNTNSIDGVIHLFIFVLPTKLFEIFVIERWDVDVKTWIGELRRK